MLRADVRKRLGAFTLDVALEAPAAKSLVVVGESGSGKTTFLRLLAGLLAPDSGTIALGETTYVDRASGVWVEPRAREIGFVAQDYALFPHLSAFENVAFGLRAQGVGGATQQTRVDAALERLGVRDLHARRPADLSGGQQQRVALARALVLEPRLLLLDEPLSALDLATRGVVRAELQKLLAELPCVTVFVTHSPVEAMVFGERIAVLESGRVSQVGARDDLLRHPRSSYVAAFMGLNLLRGRVTERHGMGLARIESGGGSLSVLAPHDAGEVFVTVNPREITLSPAPPAGSALNVLRGAIVEIVPEPPDGERLRVTLATRPALVAEITRQAAESLALRPGVEV